MANSQTGRIPRYQRLAISSHTINLVHQRNPWVVTWWSIALPGLGYILLGKPFRAIIFISWELIINMKSSINTAILYSFTGNFDLARQVVDNRWLLLYVSVLIFMMWDSYHITVALNKISVLAEREKPTMQFMKISSFGLKYLNRVNSLLAAMWSAFMPGLGHFYLQKMATGVVVLILWISIAVLSRLYEAIQLTCVGSFYEAASVLNAQWLLFLPSILGFAIYDSYIEAIAVNKLFQAKQNSYLEENFQDPDFNMPV